MTDLSRRQAALLAALLDADGAVVSYAVLGDVVGSAGVNDSAVIRRYVRRLHEVGVESVVVVPGRGLRLAQVPPDWTLDVVLWALDEMRRGAYQASVLMWRRAS